MSELNERLRNRICTRPDCGHNSDMHRLDDAQNVSPTDPAALFRCVHRGCICPDFVEPAQ